MKTAHVTLACYAGAQLPISFLVNLKTVNPTPPPTDLASCPCGQGDAYRQCCGPLHWGLAHASTAEQLMRSRYSANFYGLTDYLVTTLHPSKRGATAPPGHRRGQATRDPIWQHLQILATDRGGPHQPDGEVEFVAIYLLGSIPRQLRERSRFVKQDGRWFYVDGQAEDRHIEPPGRNAPCWCLSGQKYKKCHGASAR